MKNLFLSLLVLSLGIFLYLKFNTQTEEEKNYKSSVTPDSVVCKNATVEQNDLAYKDGLIPILSQKKSTHYLGIEKVDSTNVVALFLNRVTNKNEIIKLDFSSQQSYNWAAVIFGIIFFVIYILLIFVAEDNEDWTLKVLTLLFVVFVLGLLGYYFFIKVEDETIKMLFYIILSSSAISIFIMLAFDNYEKVVKVIFMALNLALCGIFFVYLDPGAKMFFFFNLIGLGFNLLILLAGFFMLKWQRSVY